MCIRDRLATAPVALACGAEFVLALHAARPEAFGRLYQADAWGAVAGGVAFTFVLVALVDPVTLGPLLGIEDPRTSERIKFVGGIRGTGELEGGQLEEVMFEGYGPGGAAVLVP